MKIIICLLGSVLLLSACKQESTTKVVVVSTIHAAHATNENYTYDHLFENIKKYDPDIIGIEIRQEDLQQEEEYLAKLYPKEMRMILDSFPDKVKGIDFYGNEVKGKIIAAEVFKDTTFELGKYAQLNRLLALDTVMAEEKDRIGLTKLQEEQMQMVMEDSMEEFMNGKYDSITNRYYRVLNSLYSGTKYYELIEFDRNRDIAITNNAIELVKAHPSKKVMILVGANHRGRLINAFQKENGVEIITSVKVKND